jgi:hypothetical protein
MVSLEKLISVGAGDHFGQRFVQNVKIIFGPQPFAWIELESTARIFDSHFLFNCFYIIEGHESAELPAYNHVGSGRMSLQTEVRELSLWQHCNAWVRPIPRRCRTFLVEPNAKSTGSRADRFPAS